MVSLIFPFDAHLSDYEHKSHEELRMEDYSVNRRGKVVRFTTTVDEHIDFGKLSHVCVSGHAGFCAEIVEHIDCKEESWPNETCNSWELGWKGWEKRAVQ